MPFFMRTSRSAYRLIFTKESGQFAWCGVSRLTAELLVGSSRGPDPYMFLEACCWLEARLDNGLPVAYTVLEDEAREEGLSLPALRRARKALGVRSIRNGEQWDWQLPSLTTIPFPEPFLSLASLTSHEPLAHLQNNQHVSTHADTHEATPAAPHAPEAGCPPLRAPGEEAPPMRRPRMRPNLLKTLKMR
jgi:hypothetical protein